MKKHLCNTCKFEIPTCSAKYLDILFGCDIPGGKIIDDNVLKCSCHQEID